MVRRIDFEARLGFAIAGLAQTRSRSKAIPNTLTQRQRRDHRAIRFDSTDPGSVFASIAVLGNGGGADDAIAAGSGDEDGPLHWKYGRD